MQGCHAHLVFFINRCLVREKYLYDICVRIGARNHQRRVLAVVLQIYTHLLADSRIWIEKKLHCLLIGQHYRPVKGTVPALYNVK